MLKIFERFFLPGKLRDIWEAWAHINWTKPIDYDDVLKQTIWLNSYIKVNKRVIMYESWIKAGIFKVEQLVIGNCFKSCQELRNEFGKDVNI